VGCDSWGWCWGGGGLLTIGSEDEVDQDRFVVWRSVWIRNTMDLLLRTRFELGGDECREQMGNSSSSTSWRAGSVSSIVRLTETGDYGRQRGAEIKRWRCGLKGIEIEGLGCKPQSRMTLCGGCEYCITLSIPPPQATNSPSPNPRSPSPSPSPSPRPNPHHQRNSSPVKTSFISIVSSSSKAI